MVTPQEIQLLYKRGNGFRDNNNFQQYNATVKLRINPDSSEHNYYIKGNINHELSNATYSGLTEYSFTNDPNFNPKENDEFKVFRTALDFIHTRYLQNGNKFKDKVYLNYFDRNWWRENEFGRDIEVYANSRATMNGQTSKPFIDKKIDLTQEENNLFSTYSFVIE